MQYKSYFCFFIFLLISTAGFNLLSAQNPSFPVRIDTLFIVGNEITKNQVILREIPYSLPDTLDEADFRIIRNRLQNLYLFNRVQLHLSQFRRRNALIIEVSESWYFFPVPVLFINEHDWDKISYGVQLTHYNFRGRNEKLHLGGWLGYNPNLYLSYFNPWLGGKKRLIFGISFFYKERQNKIFDLNEQRSGFSWTLGKKLSLKLQTRFSFSLERIRLPGSFREFSASGDNTDWMPTLSYEITWDNRDLYEFPRRGIYSRSNILRSGFNSRQPEFWRLTLDNRAYHPVYKKFAVGFRHLLVVNEGKLPVYDRSFLGYGDRIRGYFNRVFPDPDKYRRYNSADVSLASVELRFPLLPIRYFSIENGPVIPQLYRDLKFGISGTLFIDSGIAWQKTAEIRSENLFTGFGAGLNFHLPYVYVFRLEHAWNDKWQSQWIVDMNVSF
ncbi:MAG: BamA/TamA family outer membrane protein [Calditrichia bacterium]